MSLGKIICSRDEVAFFTAGLVREGVTFEVSRGSMGTWVIELTGGY